MSGEFNNFDVDFIYHYRDNSREQSKGKWRCDFNIHSKSWLTDFLKDRVSLFKFFDLELGIDLLQKADASLINVFTLKLENGNRIKTHGGKLILDSSLLVIKK